MDKVASLIAALDAGKLPSTEQLNSLDYWLTHSAIPAAQPSELVLSEQDQVLANDIREVIIS
jgi:hypothetical protein